MEKAYSRPSNVESKEVQILNHHVQLHRVHAEQDQDVLIINNNVSY